MTTESKKSTPQMRTINEIASDFGLARHFVRQAVLSGKVVHVKAGKKFLVNAERFSDWLNNGEQSELTKPECGTIRKLY